MLLSDTFPVHTPGVRAGAVQGSAVWQVELLPVPPGLVSVWGVSGHSRGAVSGCVRCRDSHGRCSEVLSVWLVGSSAGGGFVFLLVLVPECFGNAGYGFLLGGHRNVSVRE